MEVAYLLAFLGGAAVGLVLALILCWERRDVKRVITDADSNPQLDTATCQPGGQVVVTGLNGTAPAGATQVGLYAASFATLPVPLPPEPPTGAAPQAAFPVSCAATGSNGFVVVWAEYRSYGKRSIAYTCGSSTMNKHRVLPMVAAGALDAVPKAFLIEPGAPAPGTPSGPVAELVGLLPKAPEAVLRYVAEASTPVEPLWRALGGPGPVFEATLVLLHRSGGVGAVLTVAAVLGDRRVQLTWVTSDWRFNGANRLRCESDEPGLPSLVVAPA